MGQSQSGAPGVHGGTPRAAAGASPRSPARADGPGRTLYRAFARDPAVRDRPGLVGWSLRIAAVALGYALLAALGDALNLTPADVSPIWPAAGFALGATLIYGYPVLIGVALAVLGQEILRFDVTPVAALAGAAASAAGPLVSAWLVRRFIGTEAVFGDVPNTIRFLLLAGAAGPAVSALLGTAAMPLFPGGAATDLLADAGTWWVGDAIGVITLAPIMLVADQRPLVAMLRPRRLEFAAMLATAIASVLLAFALNEVAGLPSSHVEGLVLPVLIWAGLRFEVPGAAAAALCVAGTLAGSMLAGLGPFDARGAVTNMVSLQIHVGVLTMAALVLGAAIHSEAAAKRAKTRFLANMSHELRTPLNAILGFAELIADRPHGDDAAQYAGYARHIRDSGRHLLDLVNDVLDVARLEQDAYRLDVEPIDAAEVVAATANMVSQDAAQRDLTVVADTAPALPPVQADERALRQILLNLLTNAVKFTPDGGEVAITAARQRDDVTIVVTDSGPGIDPAEIPRLMQPFEQTRQPRSRDPAGTGLGLAISRTLAQQLGGSLTLTGRPGVGTTATLRLRVAADGA